MKKALITILAILATLLVFVSCENSIDDMFNPQTTPETVDGVWAIGSNYYATLQEAVNAVPKGTKEIAYTEIRLLKDAEGPGAVINGGAVKLNFADCSFTFTGVSGAYNDEDASYGLEITGGAKVVIENPSDRAVTIEGGESTSNRAMIMVSGNGSMLTLKGKTNLSVADNQYVLYAKDEAELFAGSEDPDPEVLVKLNGKLAATDTNNVAITGNTNVKAAEITLSGTSKVTLSTEKSGDVGIVEIGTITGSTGTAKVRIESETAGTVIINNDSPYEYAGEGTEGDVVKTESYRITYVLNGGSWDPEYTTYPTVYKADNTSASTPLPPSDKVIRENYTFGDWCTDEACTETPVTTIGPAPAGDITLYAKWLYTITYDPNGAGTGSAPAPQTNLVEGSSVTLATNSGDLAKAGQTFNGWNTTADGTGDHYNAGAELSTGIATGNTTLYAEWTPDAPTPDTFTVEYNANSAISGSIPGDQTVNVGDSVTLRTNTGSLARTGYNFNGWNTQADGNGIHYDAGQQNVLFGAAADTTVTLYAQWTAKHYTVSFNSHGGSNNPEDIQVTFNQVYGSLPDAGDKSGYSFLGWSLDEEGESPITAATTVSTASDHTLHAQWSDVPTVVVTFKANGGVEADYSQNVTQGIAKALISNAFTKSGHTFSGWNTQADGTGESYADGANITISEDVTLYAQWTENHYTIAFNGNGGSGEMASISNVAYSQEVNLTTNTFERTSYGFDGWATSPTSAKVYDDHASVSMLSAEDGATVILYAHWTLTVPVTPQIVVSNNNVTITSEITTGGDASIYYTTNGDDPTNGSIQYVGPFAIDEDYSGTIKAIAYNATQASEPGSYETTAINGSITTDGSMKWLKGGTVHSSITLGFNRTDAGTVALSSYSWSTTNDDMNLSATDVAAPTISATSDQEGSVSVTVSNGERSKSFTSEQLSSRERLWTVTWNGGIDGVELSKTSEQFHHGDTLTSLPTVTKNPDKVYNTKLSLIGFFGEEITSSGAAKATTVTTVTADVEYVAEWANYVGPTVKQNESTNNYITSIFYSQKKTALGSGVTYSFYADDGSSVKKFYTVAANAIVDGHGANGTSTAWAINNALPNKASETTIYYTVTDSGSAYSTNSDDTASFYMYISGNSTVKVADGSTGSAFTSSSLAGTGIKCDNITGAGNMPSSWPTDADPANLYRGKTKFRTGRQLQSSLDEYLTNETRANYYLNGPSVYTVWQLRYNANNYSEGLYKDWIIPSIGELVSLRDTFGATQHYDTSISYPDRNKDYYSNALYGSVYNGSAAVVTYSSSYQSSAKSWAWSNYSSSDAVASFDRNTGDSTPLRACVLVRTF